MKITVEISDEELRDRILNKLVHDAAEEIETELWEKSWGTSRYLRIYDKAITEGVRALLKEHIDSLSDRAVQAAAVTIANKGIKKLMAQLAEESANGSAE